MSETKPLFPNDAMPTLGACLREAAKAALPKALARVLMPNRTQIEWRASDLESLLPPGHRARLVWGYVERQDLEGLYAGIKVAEGSVGRAEIAPEILYALWLYATLEGVGSGRAVARLTQAHDAYRWICGGVQVNYHTLCDFRSRQGEALDDLLTDNVASLLAAGAVKFKGSAQEGMRVRSGPGELAGRWWLPGSWTGRRGCGRDDCLCPGAQGEESGNRHPPTETQRQPGGRPMASADAQR